MKKYGCKKGPIHLGEEAGVKTVTDLDKLAEVFASGSSEIVGTYRLVIQPNSELREFRTVWHGFLFTIRGAARMCVNETVYELHPGTVFHAAPDMLLDTRVIGDSEFEYDLLTYVCKSTLISKGTGKTQAEMGLSFCFVVMARLIFSPYA